MDTTFNRFFSRTIILALMVLGIGGYSVVFAAGQDSKKASFVCSNPEAIIEEAFNNAKTFAEFVETTIDVLLNNKEFFIVKFKLTETQYDQFIVALKSVQYAVDITVVKKKIMPFERLLPNSIREKGMALFAIRVKTMLYGNKKLSRKGS